MCDCKAPFIETAIPTKHLRNDYIVTRLYNADGTVQKRSKSFFAKGYGNFKIICSRCGFEIVDFEEFVQG